MSAQASHGFSARTRIIGWMMLVVALALVANAVIAARVLTARVDTAIAQELEHEGAKLRDFSQRAVDPSTGLPYRDVRSLLAGYLREAVPDADETLFSVVQGRPAHRTRAEPLARLDTSSAFVARVANATRPETGTVTSGAGQARYAVFPVRVAGDPSSGSLVVVEFLAPARTEATAILRLLAVVSLAALLVAGLTSWLVAGRVLAPIRTLRETAEGIDESDLDQRIPVTGADDVAALARTFNRMLDRLARAFAGQRQFLDDASHELRTPITVIRGHLELLRDDPTREHTLELVLDELQRMNRMVDDLMLLAKAERPDFLSPSQTDLSDLVMETIAKAAALGDRRWVIGELAEATVYADGQRLTQALMQLCANAVAHTRPGDEIRLSSRIVDDRFHLSVADQGSGVPATDRERIFERFVRRTDGVRRDGAGLGLPIVASIAHAHGGRVLVDSERGHGSCFTLDLPVAPPRAESFTQEGDMRQTVVSR
jgi:two-component system, OmpR family, sensor kinase